MKRLFAFFAVAAIAAMSAAQTIYAFLPDANRGDVQSMYNLGVCYENGYGCSPNPSQAVYWYEKAAKAGMPEACVNLGYCYEKGIGTEQSYAQAAYYYMEAALKGNPGGQANVAYCFLNGWGCTKSLDSAEKYANLALNNPQSGSREKADARNCLAEIKKARAADDDDDWFIPAQPAVATKDLPLSDLKAKAEQGDAEAQYYLGKRYEKGDGVGQSTKSALLWWKKSSEKGFAKAQVELGLCFELASEELGILLLYSNTIDDLCEIFDVYEEDFILIAEEYYEMAAKQNDAEGQYQLAELEKIFGHKEDAIYWYKKAAAQGHQKAKEELAKMK